MSIAREFQNFIQGRGPNIAPSTQGFGPWLSSLWEHIRDTRQCRYCLQSIPAEIEPKVVKPYWTFSGDRDVWDIAHPDCDGREESAICKAMDAACTDCGHFQRIQGVRGTCVNPQGVKHGQIYSSYGNTAESRPCWESRKA